MERYLKLAIACSLFAGGTSYLCPDRCNSTGYWEAAVECGTLGFCCGGYLDLHCCTDYWQRVHLEPVNATQEDCAQVRAAMLAGTGASQHSSMASFLITGAIVLWHIVNGFQSVVSRNAEKMYPKNFH